LGCPKAEILALPPYYFPNFFCLSIDNTSKYAMVNAFIKVIQDNRLTLGDTDKQIKTYIPSLYSQRIARPDKKLLPILACFSFEKTKIQCKNQVFEEISLQRKTTGLTWLRNVL
jgi:hypothetical protein